MRLRNKDIAQMLGISATAVSLALNGHPGVSDETRRKVLELAAQGNPRLDGNGASFASPAGPARSIAFVIHKETGEVINENQFFSNIVETVQQEAMHRGYTLTISHKLPSQEMPAQLDYLQSLEVDGLLIQATELTEEALEAYLSLGIPSVLLDGYFDLRSVDAVTLDDQTSMYRAYAYAREMGHENIGFLAGSAHIKNFEHHLDGFWKGVRELGAKGNQHPVVTLGCPFEDAYLNMKEFLTSPPAGFEMPSCLIASLDNIALGAMKALREAGCAVPDDVSVIGYGNTGVAAISDPPLTTTQINMHDLGRVAVQLLADRMANPGKRAVSTTMVSSELVERASVRRIER